MKVPHELTRRAFKFPAEGHPDGSCEELEDKPLYREHLASQPHFSSSRLTKHLICMSIKIQDQLTWGCLIRHRHLRLAQCGYDSLVSSW